MLDGSGNRARDKHTIIIRNGWIEAVGPSENIPIPEEYEVFDLQGKTVIPGLIGIHNHLRLPQGALLRTGPKLYLACGVTTIQTCGTGHPAEELSLAKAIKRGELAGPDIIPSSPYFTGKAGKEHLIRFTNEKDIRDTIRYWAGQGAQWVKVYRHTRPEELQIIVDEVHRLGMKVTGHLCATTFNEAIEVGIDAIEHGYLHAYDFATNRETGICGGGTEYRATLDLDNEEVKLLIKKLIDNGISLSSTLAIFEAQTRTARADQRTLRAMSPYHVTAYEDLIERKKAAGSDWYFKEEWLWKAMDFDLAFFRAGGLLCAGPDPGLHNLPGFGDQRNYELLISAGFAAGEAIQVMTFNGAKRLGLENTGLIRENYRANLVVLNGHLDEDPKVIRNTRWVIKNGRIFDSLTLITSVEGQVGSSQDEQLPVGIIR